jgi:transcriptional regulator with XRE-family HTH domain
MDKKDNRYVDDETENVGRTIRTLREAGNLRQSEVAKRLGMSAAQLCHIEKSKNTPSLPTLRRIAEALGTTISELTEGAPAASQAMMAPACEESMPDYVAEAPESDSYAPMSIGYGGGAAKRDRAFLPPHISPVSRAAASDMDKLPERCRKQVVKRIFEYMAVEEKAGVPVRPSLTLSFPVEAAIGEGEVLGWAVRRAWDIGSAILFDSISFLESKGIRIVPADLPDTVDAIPLWDSKDSNAWIVLRKSATDERQQFRTMMAIASTIKYVTAADGVLVEDTPDEKRFERAFASSFLMPLPAMAELCFRLGIDDESWTWELLLREKVRFSVSAESFLYRLQDLDLIRPYLRQQLVRRLREWYAENSYAEPNPSLRQAMRHSRFSDLKLLVENEKH